MSYNLPPPKPCLIAQVVKPVIVPLKADLQARACSSDNHDNDHSLMPIQDARSDDYALGTPSSEECICPTKVWSKNRWSFPLLIILMTMVTLL